MKKRIAIGHHDFERIIEEDIYYVDKSFFIQKIIENKNGVFLFPRPRRFGKTLNMMLLRRYFEISESSKGHLFEGLKIQKWEQFNTHLGKYPVIWLSFKDLKQQNWKDCYESTLLQLQQEYQRHSYLENSPNLSKENKIYFNKIQSLSAHLSDYQLSIVKLCELLYLHHGVKPMLLIDEYDTPINNSYIYHFYEECIGFMRLLYSNCLKDNNFVERAVLTGIYRVAKESIFSGLNNLKVSTLIDDEFADCFGFTPEEVHQLLVDTNVLDRENDVTRWYNGYLFGKEQVIYNPWSILSFLENTQHELKPYWVNTSSNDIIKKLIIEGDAEVKQEIEVLLGGGSLRKTISEDVVFGNIQETPDALWNFFLFSGYLKVVNKVFDEERQEGQFKIPNIEIKTIFKDSILYWFSKSQTYDKFNVVLDNLKKGRIKDFSKYFADFIRQACSYYDFADNEPERVYHALVLGMMVQLQSEYRITSNRESGYGRYDVMLHPLKPALPAFVFEFKKFEEDDEESIQDTLSTAMQQMKTKNYASTLQQEGHTNIHLIAIAFKGKEVKMRFEEVFPDDTL
jgi:hypothetical protein